MSESHMEQDVQAAFAAQESLAADADTSLLRVIFYTPENENFARAIPPVSGEHLWTFEVTAEAWRFVLYCMQHLQLALGQPVNQVLIATEGDAGYFSTVPQFVQADDPTNVGGVTGNQTPASFGGKAKMFMASGGSFTLLTNQFASSATYPSGNVDGKTVMQELANATGGYVMASDQKVTLNLDGTASTTGAQWLATHGQPAPAQSVPAPGSGSAQIALGPH